MTLIGNFQVTTGEWIAPTLGPTRTEADFASPIEQTSRTDPEASWVFVVDNLTFRILSAARGPRELTSLVTRTKSIGYIFRKRYPILRGAGREGVDFGPAYRLSPSGGFRSCSAES